LRDFSPVDQSIYKPTAYDDLLRNESLAFLNDVHSSSSYLHKDVFVSTVGVHSKDNGRMERDMDWVWNTGEGGHIVANGHRDSKDATV